MDFNAALETFAEAWVVANTPTAVSNPEKQKAKSTDELPTMLLREQIATGSQEVKSASPKKTDTNSTQLANAKSLPIHCVIEQINGVPSFDNTSSLTAVPDNIELDSYAILPNSTLLQDLVRAALLKLGYSSVDAINAKGAIQIKKWKPLCFDSISDNTQATIEDILGELTNVATLRIRLASTDMLLLPNEWNDHAVRRAVHILLKEMNQLTLGKLSPLCQSMISNIIF
ncbi:DNA-binding protein SATB2 [Patella vulgata]|uniref:DNA-binding protein SATB2 n=1 Tax=Patella vulgata TaxID=6465 RepID=UPI0024A9F114|nr:DNA-binding protein SATB2 [Patella vulgata]